MWLPIIVVSFVAFIMWIGNASGLNDYDKDKE